MDERFLAAMAEIVACHIEAMGMVADGRYSERAFNRVADAAREAAKRYAAEALTVDGVGGDPTIRHVAPCGLAEFCGDHAKRLAECIGLDRECTFESRTVAERVVHPDKVRLGPDGNARKATPEATT